MKKILSIVLTFLTLFTLIGCDSNKANSANDSDSNNLIGISFPSKSSQRFFQDGEAIKTSLESLGYTVELQFAENNDISSQISQIENMINNGCDLIVVTSIDETGLEDVMTKTKDAGIPVISYDCLIKNSDGVTYFATFDYMQVGVLQGKYIEEKLDLVNAKSNDKIYNIEYVFGDLNDVTTTLIFDGAMSILQKYVSDGILRTPSGQVASGDLENGYDISAIANSNSSLDTAQSKFDFILSTYYADGNQLDAILASNDVLALGCINAIDSKYSGIVYPVITGLNADKLNIPHLIKGTQGMSIFNDPLLLSSKLVETIDTIMKGNEPKVDDISTYNNGAMFVPTILCEPILCNYENYRELLIDSGYYTLADIGQ